MLPPYRRGVWIEGGSVSASGTDLSLTAPPDSLLTLTPHADLDHTLTQPPNPIHSALSSGAPQGQIPTQTHIITPQLKHTSTHYYNVTTIEPGAGLAHKKTHLVCLSDLTSILMHDWNCL